MGDDNDDADDDDDDNGRQWLWPIEQNAVGHHIDKYSRANSRVLVPLNYIRIDIIRTAATMTMALLRITRARQFSDSGNESERYHCQLWLSSSEHGFNSLLPSLWRRLSDSMLLSLRVACIFRCCFLRHVSLHLSVSICFLHGCS